ncbi:hypothetical protein [Chitinophaga tropicalis]|uniref:Uncharacterized protein n=1 Tax=Chitinophaga tropicalis TaxID=2683588 RepID=A0A7K1U964_9BACT|nr:hypothetical protein [Chitinophaga tropicalis]MVT10893.1 hypothetical protein [Chitinophaga tropicalis]
MNPIVRNKGSRTWSGHWSCIGVLLFLLAACSKEDEGVTNPITALYAIPPEDTLKGMIGENTLLTNNRTWYIDGWLCITNEASLNIEPGTVLKVLKGSRKDVEGGLIITRGATMIANGTKYAPVIITASDTSIIYNRVKMGIMLLGKAPVAGALSVTEVFPGMNGSFAYGGQLPGDSSGVLQNLQIIYPYIRRDGLKAGLFLYGTGSRTIIKDINVRPVVTGIHMRLK